LQLVTEDGCRDDDKDKHDGDRQGGIENMIANDFCLHIFTPAFAESKFLSVSQKLNVRFWP
jgi:hypothetical protein